MPQFTLAYGLTPVALGAAPAGARIFRLATQGLRPGLSYDAAARLFWQYIAGMALKVRWYALGLGLVAFFQLCDYAEIFQRRCVALDVSTGSEFAQ